MPPTATLVAVAALPVHEAELPVVDWFSVGKVQLVKVPEAGVPSAGVVSVGLVSVLFVSVCAVVRSTSEFT